MKTDKKVIYFEVLFTAYANSSLLLNYSVLILTCVDV